MKTPESLHQEHLQWLNELNFYQDEIKFFQNQLLQLILKQHKTINMEKVGEFRRSFLNQLMAIDDFRYQIVLHEQKLAQKIQLNQPTAHDHPLMREDVETFEKAFLVLKTEFKNFLAHSIHWKKEE